MNLDLVVCPACRTATEGRIDVRTLERTGDILSCECGRRYPERDLSPEVAALLVEGGPDDAPYARLQEHLSVYMDAQWGDRAVPPGPFGAEALREKLAERAQQRVDLAVELGCSVGRFVSELAAGAFHVMGVDMHAGAIRRARRILDGESVAFGRRIAGRHYEPAVVQAGDRAIAAKRCTLVCGDALDPPLIHGMFGRVVALNVLDSVSQPRQLLSVLDGLCARGGEVILSSPYAWQSSVMADSERIGGADPGADVARVFREGIGLGATYTIEDECDLVWTLRRDARSTVTYRTHYLRARKS
jgi:SAM-dependent methyltransferase